MNTLAIVWALFSLLFSNANSQIVIENPEKPLNKNAGRVIELKEMWNTTDKGGLFFLKNPHRLKIAEDGSIFLQDKDQLLKFSSGGKFVKNLYKKGQGPGEISDSFTYLIHKDKLFIKDYSQRRIFRMDLEGTYIDQVNSSISAYNLIGIRDDAYICSSVAWPPQSEQTGTLLPLLETIKLVSEDGRAEKDIYTFKTRWYMAPHVSTQWDPDIEVLNDDSKLLFSSHLKDYLIEILDLDLGRIVKKFNRKYEHIEHITEKRESDQNKKFGLPNRDYEWDVFDLYLCQGRLWVKTSTIDKERGELYDVFDFNGQFMDSFHLGAGRILLNTHRDELFILEKDKEENLILVKYKILN